MTLAEILAAERAGDGTWRFTIGRDWHGAFGGAFGGLVAAGVLVAARSVAPGRVPVALDCRFLRQLPAGTATATARVVHTGRTMSSVAVDLIGPDERLATTASVTLADRTTLHPLTLDEPASAVPAYAGAIAWQGPVEIPILQTLAPRAAQIDGATATVLRAPWNDPDTGPELACLAGDFAVGPPVSRMLGDTWVPHPNPDVSLRFTGAEAGDELVGIGRLASMIGGVATTSIEVRSGGALLAVGVSCSLLLPPR